MSGQPRCRHLVFAAVFTLVNLGSSQAEELAFRLTPQGVPLLSWAGKGLVTSPDNGAWLDAVVGYHGSANPSPVSPVDVRLLTGDTVLRTYPWGRVSIAYRAIPDGVDVTVEGTNTASDAAIEALGVVLVPFRFPGGNAPAAWAEAGPPKARATDGSPALLARYGSGTVALINDVGADQTEAAWAVAADGSCWATLRTSKPIFRGETVVAHAHLRFGTADAPAATFVEPLYEVYRTAHPEGVPWKDRRPIGSIFLARVNQKWPGNPRGWFNDPKLDLNTPAGADEFRKRLFEKANYSITLLRGAGAQGMILWDLEGQEFPQGEATYAGDPTLLARLAPEMNAVADDLFRLYGNQGFKTGLCLRANLIVFRRDGSFYQREYDTPEDLLAGLDHKIAYARKRWGCTLFYVDSNGGKHGVYDAWIFERLRRLHPDCLIAPENCYAAYYACTSPYRELRPSAPWANVAKTGDALRALYPHAFSVINLADGDYRNRRAELIDGVRGGDILLFRAFARCPEYPYVQEIYRAATEGAGG